jgi:murein DD-endopeptidase MepM/ murein hydrolase activator NlpD
MFGRSIVLMLALLSGCAVRTAPPAPLELHTHAGPPVLSEPVPIIHPDRVVVASADTLYGLSRRYGVPMRAIIDANGLQPPYRLVAGGTLILPQVRTHLVRVGDTLAGVARGNGVDISTLAATNHLAPPYVIRTGETLILPAPVETAAVAPAPPPPVVASVPLAPPASEPAPPQQAAPPPEPAMKPTPSPQQAATPPEPQAKPAPPQQAAAPPEPQATPTPPPEVALAEPITPPPEPKPHEQTASLPPPAPLAPTVPAAIFIWPVHGHVLSSYGASAQGTHNDGIDIAAPLGTPVLAAGAGEVAYAGNELKGYGNLILVKHDNGYITAYAHNSTLLVKRGDRVGRGQQIAKVGATGAVDQPQLHFEIRRGTRALDPSDYLPAQAATASR